MKTLGIVLGGAALSFFAAVPAFAAGGGPSAIDDSVVAENKVVHVDVLANDSGGDAEIDAATLRIASVPSHGEAVVLASGSPRVKYTAAGSQAGVDTFTYEICNADGLCARATVIVNFLGEVTTTTTTSPTTTSPPPPDTFPFARAPTVPVEPVGPPTTTTVRTTPTSPAATIPGATPATVTTAMAGDVHALGELALASNDRQAVGTTLGEARGVKLDEDVAYLGRSGLDTLALVATPALMVSGFVGFLMVGLPQNAFGFLFGVLAGRRRKKPSGLKEELAAPKA